MKARLAGDVSALPTYGFGAMSPTFWGTLAFMAIEGAGFALAIGTYLYLVHINPAWPLAPAPPNHWPGTLMTLLLLASLWPNHLAERHGRAQELGRVRLDLIVMTAIGLAAVAIRFWEFGQLNIRWDQNAYGSITWVILGLHATHLITDLGDTIVLAVLMFTRHATGRRFSDVEDNAAYWYFVVASWLPLYLVVYWVPRW